MAEESRQVRILVTGFGPFPDVPYNVTSWLAGALAESPRIPGVALFAQVLPVSWEDAQAACLSAMAETRPQAILHFGVSRRAAGFAIEQRAYNLRSGRVDHNGVSFPPCRIAPVSPAVLRSTLPCIDMAAALRRDGLPVRLSNDPGRYLCNMTLFSTLLAAQRLDGRIAQSRAPKPPLAAFVHVPALGVDGAVAAKLTDSELLRGARILIRTAARAVLRGRQVATAGGTCSGVNF
jgi:pyroglutamyl-peptidase